MKITRQTAADQIAAYLQHRLTLSELVDWAERAMMDGEFPDGDLGAISEVVSRLGVADVRAFGLSWEDCESLLRRLGFAPQVSVVAA